MKLLKTNIIKIGEQDYPIKLTIRAMILYEQMSGHSISSLQNMEDITTIFYCCIKAGGFTGNYEQFLDLIDPDLDSITAFSNAMIEPDVEKKEEAR
jgi:hypothetical protein